MNIHPTETALPKTIRRQALSSLGASVIFAQVLAVLVIIASLLAGVGLATVEVETDGYFASASSHPFIAWGIGAATFGCAFGALLVLLANFADAWRETHQ